ncbi:MAG: hypothetical protein H7145_02775 [Akkermansiaceae bacterium]|nr:hypothetical protein [Armatimonadota bacterium]
MSDTPYYSDQEAKDANEHLLKAMEAIEAERFEEAERILLAIVANTPADYRYQYDSEDGELCIKFWDQAEFIHYVTRLQAQGKADRSIIWQGNAYGKAHYYLGFLYVKRRKPGDALRYLEAGLALEPDKPLMRMEYANAIGMAGDRLASLREFEKVVAQGDAIVPELQAVALRGKGFQLIELARLVEAETAFRDSLKVDPRNPIALHELKYIRHLRDGGEMVGTQFSDDDKEVPKKWWQFWRS